MKKKVVMTFGTFDVFHPGHRFYLSEARKLGDRLLVIVALDSTVEKIKGKRPRETQDIRVQNIIKSGLADEVLLGSVTDHYQILFKKNPDILFFGYDQKSFNDDRLTRFLRENNLHPQIVIGQPFEPEKWKSSLIWR